MTPQPHPDRTLKWEPHWITPPELYKKLDDEFHFNYDPCPFPKPKDYNGIEANWGTSNYVNPPFHPENGIGPTAFVRKAIEENKKGKTVVLTIPTQSYVNPLLEAGAELRSLGRVKWLHTVTREPMKGPSPITAFILRSRPAQSSCIWIEDEDGNWYTDCGQIHQFTNGTPKENHYGYCPYCGKSLRTGGNGR